MAKLNYFLLCENVIRNDDGKLTLVNIFDSVQATELPFVHGKFTLAFSIHAKASELDGKEVKISIKLVAPSKKIVGKVDGTGQWIKGKDGMPKEGNIASSVDLSGQAIFTEEGVHAAELLMDGKSIATVKFNITKIQEA